MFRKPLIRVLVVAVGAALLLSGCSEAVKRGEAPSPIASAANVYDESLPPAPLTEAMANCMRDAGQEVIFDWSGGLTGPEMSSAQAKLWTDAAGKCGEDTGYYNTQLSQDQLRELYSQELAERDCLAKLGYPSGPPPSEQTFIDTYASADQYSAFHVAGADKARVAEMQRLVRQCPPPTWFLNVKGLVK